MVSKIYYLELYVTDCDQSAHFYNKVLGFSILNCLRSEADSSKTVSCVLKQGDIYLLLTSAIKSDSIAQEVYLHGDGVKDIAFQVENVSEAFETAIKRGAKAVLQPTRMIDPLGEYDKASIAAFGDSTHSFISIKRLSDSCLRKINNPYTLNYMTHIDHLAIAVESTKLYELADFYKNVFNFHISYEQNIDTGRSGMNSLVMNSSCQTIKLVLVSPLDLSHQSQINDFLQSYHGSGVQHIAFSTKDILACTQKLRNNGLDFLTIPDKYYDDLPKRIGIAQEEADTLKKQEILIDRENSGFLLQIFSKPIHARRTLFIEMIERRGAEGFGSGNILALFQAIEREQVSS